MDSLAYIVEKYKLDLQHPSPIEIPNVGRNTLAALFGELGFKVGAEVGTEKGIYADILCSSNVGVKLYCVDAWECYVGYRDYLDPKVLADAYETAKKRLKPYNVELIREYSMDAVKHFPDGSLDFVYIDANHEFPWVVQDVFYWSKKIRRGGIVSGHDYYRSIAKSSRCHVVAAIDGFTTAYKVYPWFLLGTKAKVPGQIRDNSRSWFWVKE